jgi:ABC-2 type transport system permease protein
MPTGAHIVGKLVATMAFSAIAIALIYAVAAMAGVNLSASQWALMASTQITAVIPFALIGLGVGYRMGSKSAVAIVNVLFLGMAVMGGLWIPLALMPEAIQTIAWVLPSYHLGELALMAVGRSEIAYFWLHAGPLALLSLAAAVFAWTGQQRHAA